MNASAIFAAAGGKSGIYNHNTINTTTSIMTYAGGYDSPDGINLVLAQQQQQQQQQQHLSQFL